MMSILQKNKIRTNIENRLNVLEEVTNEKLKVWGDQAKIEYDVDFEGVCEVKNNYSSYPSGTKIHQFLVKCIENGTAIQIEILLDDDQIFESTDIVFNIWMDKINNI